LSLPSKSVLSSYPLDKKLMQPCQTRLNITEISIPSSSSAPTAAAPSASDDVPAEEKPKEKTIFTVKLEKFETAAKAKIIREVKAMMPNMNLVEVSQHRSLSSIPL